VTQRDPLRRELILETIAGALAQIPKKIKAYVGRFKTAYMSSGITTYFDNYVKRATTVTAAVFPITLIITLLIITLVLKWGFTLNIALGSILAATLVSAITGGIFLIYPYYVRRENKGKIENGIIYFLSYMTALSASGMSIEKILERLTEVETNPPLILLAKKFSMDVKLFGMDVRGALKDIAEMSPSPVFAKQLEGIRNVLATSGDMKSLLAYEVQRQIQVKQGLLKAKVNTLVYIGELYVAIMVVTPILFIMIIAILSILGTNALGGSPVMQMNLMVFLGIPILGFIFTLILDQTLGSED
jgi:archaellum biogenesis protein FlaJ (TadC family)